jgi:hypothetical protein
MITMMCFDMQSAAVAAAAIKIADCCVFILKNPRKTCSMTIHILRHTYLYNIIIPLAVHAGGRLLLFFFFTYLHKRHEVTKGTQKNTNMKGMHNQRMKSQLMLTKITKTVHSKRMKQQGHRKQTRVFKKHEVTRRQTNTRRQCGTAQQKHEVTTRRPQRKQKKTKAMWE